MCSKVRQFQIRLLSTISLWPVLSVAPGHWDFGKSEAAMYFGSEEMRVSFELFAMVGMVALSPCRVVVTQTIARQRTSPSVTLSLICVLREVKAR
jgi:hypothetical protein